VESESFRRQLFLGMHDGQTRSAGASFNPFGIRVEAPSPIIHAILKLLYAEGGWMLHACMRRSRRGDLLAVAQMDATLSLSLASVPHGSPSSPSHSSSEAQRLASVILRR